MDYKFSAAVLSKYPVSYYQCKACGLIQTETPYWLDEAYGSAIASLDVGLVQRNISMSNLVRNIVNENFDPSAKYLDFAGGYGLLVRLMRDKGYDFYRYDGYCENIFAEYFDRPLLFSETEHYELVTAFEVLEHLYNPLDELAKIFSITDTVLFSTELLVSNITDVSSWWYFDPETGQHITFYTEASLRKMADELSVNFYTNNRSIHMMTRRLFESDPFHTVSKVKIISRVRNALSRRLAVPLEGGMCNDGVYVHADYQYIQKDYQYIKNILNEKKHNKNNQ